MPGHNDVRARGRNARHPSDIPTAGWKDIIRRTAAQMKADHVPVVAAGVAFYAWIALVPALVLAMTLWGLVAAPDTVTNQLERMTGTLSPEVSSVLVETLSGAVNASSGGLTLGLVGSALVLLWTASSGMDALMRGVNLAYDEDRRSFVRRRGLALLLTLGAIVVALIALALVVGTPILLGALGLGGGAALAVQIGRWVLLALIAIGSLAVIYRVAPNRDAPRWRWLSWGAVLATLVWLAASGLFSLYVSNFGSYGQTYGALAGVIILNLWLLVSAFAALLGAEVDAEMEAQTRRDTTEGRPRPMGERHAVKADRLGARQ